VLWEAQIDVGNVNRGELANQGSMIRAVGIVIHVNVVTVVIEAGGHRQMFSSRGDRDVCVESKKGRLTSITFASASSENHRSLSSNVREAFACQIRTGIMTEAILRKLGKCVKEGGMFWENIRGISKVGIEISQ